jgi:hypothetical protein
MSDPDLFTKVCQMVADAPPMTNDQIQCIAGLLNSGGERNGPPE